MDAVVRRAGAGAAGGERAHSSRDPEAGTAAGGGLGGRWRSSWGGGGGGGGGGANGGACTASRVATLVLGTLLVGMVVIALQREVAANAACVLKLQQREQEALRFIVEIDRLSRRNRDAELRNEHLAGQCTQTEQMARDGEQARVALRQELAEAKAKLVALEEQLTAADNENEQFKMRLQQKLALSASLQAELDERKRQPDQASACPSIGDSISSAQASSTHPAGFAWPASTMQKRTPRRLAIIIPHAVHQENRLSQFYARSHTIINTPACDKNLPYTQYRDLFVYSNKLVGGTVETNKERTENYKENMKRLSMYSCYGSVTFLSANLTEEQDPYPTKTRNNGVIADLFFKIFEAHSTSHTPQCEHITHQPPLAGDVQMDQFRKNYDYFFLMESDVQAIRPYWLDNVYEHAEYAMEDFWIKGSIYRGPATPKEYCMNIYWGCGDHFNGNSMFRLGDPVFDSFLRLDTRVDPGKDVGINHDAQIVRVLRDPAVWRFYQRYAHKFVYSEFIQHRPPLIIDSIRRIFNNTYVAHQVSHEAEEAQDGELDEIYLDRANVTIKPS